MAAAQTVEVWPENWETVTLFTQVGTQWRVGPGGVVGLDYQALFKLMDMSGLTHDEWWEKFHDVRIMEAAALEAMRQSD